MQCQLATRWFQTSHFHRPDGHTRQCCRGVSALVLVIWSSSAICGTQSACWTAGPPIATTVPEKKPEESPPAHDSSPRPAAPMSAEEIYARASPAVVTLKTYNDSHEVTFSGSGFILADRFTKPLQVDAEATIFAASQSKHLGEFYRRREANLTSNLLLPNSNKTVVEEGDEFRKARQRAFDRDWPHLQQVFIVTNYHVIDSAVSIDVKMHDGSTGFVSQVIKEDDSADVAILNAWLPSDKRPAAIALSAVPPNIGAKVFVIGSPLGLENSLSEGLISGIRELDLGHSILQTSAAISHGSSGGPILAANGRVVGIATASHSGGQNLNFAVPAAEVLRLLDKPETPRKVSRGRSFTKEESYEFDRTYAALNSKTGGATAAKALLDSKMAALLHGAYGAKMPIKSLEEARQATIEAIRSVPPEFQYLAYFYSGEFQSKEGCRLPGIRKKPRPRLPNLRDATFTTSRRSFGVP